ncbi:bifunctional hydroxymethylpyrimidine kinase/phosphomethylpyrimidine kinase [Succinispira mobilis]|uniref:bifunctional hydroxymethylpyrimidine kinase/phosphomethylpyrimidine kinase n=1 Tax=Succinispira mobilis TaxID=78120 RepID=UPI00036E2990|nr:bifunctional hydroxymethylpyrimidine kinase/phosphomethylpyrimidine kinase [Succinispira mobilis]
MKNLLTIAGSDSSGGAGIQADLKTFAAHGTFGMSVITAITAQNTQGVRAVENITATMVKEQIDAIFEDIPVHAVKIGMVSETPIIECIADRLRYYQPEYIVVDPVMVSKSGYLLLEPSACKALCQKLIPLATLVTPNLPEAEVIVGFPVKTKADMLLAAKHIINLGAKNVLVKGGHLESSADDLLFDGTTSTWFTAERQATKNTHGTGCTLSSALASNLANNVPLIQAVTNSKAYISKAIEYSLALGKGCGPTHHFVDLYKLAGWL